MNKKKLEDIKKENERLEYEFWKNFYETKNMLEQTLEKINREKVNNNLNKDVN